MSIFSSPEHNVLRVSYCDSPLSIILSQVSVPEPSCFSKLAGQKLLVCEPSPLEFSCSAGQIRILSCEASVD